MILEGGIEAEVLTYLLLMPYLDIGQVSLRYCTRAVCCN